MNESVSRSGYYSKRREAQQFCKPNLLNRILATGKNIERMRDSERERKSPDNRAIIGRGGRTMVYTWGEGKLEGSAATVASFAAPHGAHGA